MNLDLTGVPVPQRPLTEEEIGKMYIESAIALPEKISDMVEQLENLNDSLAVIALYCSRKGVAEGLIGPGELDDQKP